MRVGTLLAAVSLLAGCASSGALSSVSADGGQPGRPTDPFGSATSKPSSKGSPSKGSTTASPTSGASSGSTGNVKTGTQLKAIFPANSALPKPWQRYEQSALDSGETVDSYTAAPLFSKDACPSIDDESVRGLMLGWRVTHAGLDLTPGDEISTTVDMEASGFQPGDAAKQLAAIKEYMARCQTFQAKDMFTQDTVNETVKVTPIAGVGDEAVEIDVIPDNAKTYGSHICIARVGDVLFGADSLTQDNKADVDVQLILKLMAANYKP